MSLGSQSRAAPLGRPVGGGKLTNETNIVILDSVVVVPIRLAPKCKGQQNYVLIGARIQDVARPIVERLHGIMVGTEIKDSSNSLV